MVQPYRSYQHPDKKIQAIVRRFRPRTVYVRRMHLKDCDGYFQVAKGRKQIVINRVLGAEDFLGVFLHEIGHYKYRHHWNKNEFAQKLDGTEMGCCWEEEYEASLYAYEQYERLDIAFPLRVKQRLKSYVEWAIRAAHPDQLPVPVHILKWVFGDDYPREFAE